MIGSQPGGMTRGSLGCYGLFPDDLCHANSLSPSHDVVHF